MKTATKLFLIIAAFGCSNQWASDNDLLWQGKIGVFVLPFILPAIMVGMDYSSDKSDAISEDEGNQNTDRINQEKKELEDFQNNLQNKKGRVNVD